MVKFSIMTIPFASHGISTPTFDEEFRLFAEARITIILLLIIAVVTGVIEKFSVHYSYSGWIYLQRNPKM